jgi:hypothetical protein
MKKAERDLLLERIEEYLDKEIKYNGCIGINYKESEFRVKAEAKKEMCERIKKKVREIFSGEIKEKIAGRGMKERVEGRKRW